MQILHFPWIKEGKIDLKLCSKCWVPDLTAEKADGHAFFTWIPMPRYLVVNKLTSDSNRQQLDLGTTDGA